MTDIDGGDIAKCSSRSRIEGLEPTGLIDGKVDGSGWSSKLGNGEMETQEIVLRLRERSKWNINRVEIYPKTTLGKDEIMDVAERLSSSKNKEIKSLKESETPDQEEIDTLAKAVELLDKAQKQVKKADGIDQAKLFARTALEEAGGNLLLLEDESYFPKEISIYAADFSGQLLPQLYCELDDDEKEETADPATFAKNNGWQYLGDVTVAPDGAVGGLDFEAITASHVLIQVKSNYGADRVKISEIKVLTPDVIPETSNAKAATAWPNVAAIGYKPGIVWQLLAYLIITAAEVMVSITCLEFAYTQAPKKMKSFIMSLFMLSISLGNLFAAGVNFFIQNEDGSSKLEGANYYWFFTIMMLVTAVAFLFVARGYKVQNYIQDEG
jgi:hypothetical protein